MLGNITVNRDELKVRDFETYQAFYCGVCQDIKKNSGQLSRFTLTYDMTFLAILFTSLYGAGEREEDFRCILHPLKKKKCIRNKYTSYAADMCVILTYHNLMDDWIDEKKVKSRLFAEGICHSYRKAAKKYPRQTKAVQDYIEELHKVEKSDDLSVDLASGLTGKMFEEIFKAEEDSPFNRELGSMGFYMGKFIYLMDAYEDVEEDRKKGNYNPFKKMAEEENFPEKGQEILEMMMSSAAIIFERLPIVDYVDILKNILYDGAWVKIRTLKNGDKK